jgi:Ca2+/Na+ antiporter
MVPPVRWYYILSSWIFLLSTLYPLLQLPTFPLNVMASVGCFEIILNPHNENLVKNIYILFIHIAPFFWIPVDLSIRAFQFGAAVVAIYLAFLFFLGENPIHIYQVLLKERHTAQEFLRDRFGV